MKYGTSHGEAESPYAWLRLAVSLALSTIGGVGMWSVVVALPAVQAEFGVARGDASLPYTLTMIGFGLASILMGRLADRFGIIVPVLVGAVAMACGYVAAAWAGNLWLYALAQGLLIGVGSAATFAPLLAHVSLWFTRRRGIAVTVAMGLASKSVESASNTPMFLTLLPFLSSGFVLTATLPVGLRQFAEYQPFTSVTQTVRGLLVGGPVGSHAVAAIAWSIGIAV